jgi:citrate lyase subunit beta / citryl-CoA lyase
MRALRAHSSMALRKTFTTASGAMSTAITATTTVANVRPRRSALYMPGSNARALDKGRSLSCDVILFDCEDAVSPVDKVLARNQIAEALAAGGFGDRELVVRVNPLASPWGEDDVVAMAEAGAHAVLIAKAENQDEVNEVAALLHKTCRSRDEDKEMPDIWCMIETPLGVLRAAELASMHPVTCLVAGTSDLAADLRCDGEWQHRTALLPFLSHTVLAARAHGVAGEHQKDNSSTAHHDSSPRYHPLPAPSLLLCTARGLSFGWRASKSSG